MAYDSYLVQETDGTSRLTLEDGSGSLLLEIAVEVAATTTGKRPSGLLRNPQVEAQIEAFRRQLDDEDAIATLLTIL